MGSCAAPSAKGDDKFITTDYLQQCPKINYLRKIDPFVFEELLLEGFEAHGFRTIRNKRYTGDGGIDGRVIIGKYRYLIQAKRYRGHIALQHVQEFEKLLKRHNCRGSFCHTGKTGAGSKSVSIASERMEIISGQRLIDLLTPGSSFTIATAPQTMMKRTAATLETSTIVKDAGKENRYHES
ncbi:restriction endonuclease [Klebsiella pneumoniae]|uniref:restriction endonuclease n=1 Tax=Klebsiella pneumoniae TaxID=573 RepID=UPI0038910548